jgi:signal transduction histidine kinase
VTDSPHQPGVDQEFLHETARLIAARTPIAMLAFVVSVGIAWPVEHQAHPERDGTFAGIYALEALVCCVAVLLVRIAQPSLRRLLYVTVTAVGLLITLLATYYVRVSGDGEMLVLILVYVVVGAMVMFPWGAHAQVGVVGAAVVAYIVAVTSGVRTDTDLGLNMLGLILIGAVTVGTAAFLAQHRLGFFRQTAALKRVNAALENASRTKTEFLADVSHELRTPLNVMIGYLQMLEEHAFGVLPSDATEPIARMRQSADMLLGLVNDFLDLSRLESRQLKLHREAVDVALLLAEVAGLVQPLLRGKPVDLVVERTEGLTVCADRNRLRQVLVNLLANAAKFTREGRIELRAHRLDTEQVSVEVSDTGPGIAEEEHATIFEPYRRGAGTSQFGGVGIGLALSRQLTEAMGGSMKVESAPGRGATFSVCLPSLPHADIARGA